MSASLTSFVAVFETAVTLYLFAVSTIYLGLTLIGFAELFRLRLIHHDSVEINALESSSLVPPVSILAPAYNEAATIGESIRSMLQLAYPEFEVVVINDGSKDDTLRLLISEFHLYKSARYYESPLETKPVRAVYESMDPIPLVVIDKENGGKADSLNAGINVARYPLVCSVDSDSLLERDALMTVARPFVEDPTRTLAVGGIIRVANGCTIESGRVTQVGLPSSWIARFQVVEYLRAFLGGRVGFSAFNCLLVISGAFGLFSRSAVLALGGYNTKTVGEDMELIVRLHRWARKQKREYRIAFQADPVCWTEVPENLRILRRQRNRWQRGTIETLWLHREMFGRKSYGLLGMAAIPYFVLFEMLGPLVELTGYAITILGLAFGFVDLRAAIPFFVAAVLYGVILSTSAIVLEELSTRRYPHVGNLLILILAGVLENLGFRQLLTLWRAQAFWDIWKGKTAWGEMERKGFQAPASAPKTGSV